MRIVDATFQVSDAIWSKIQSGAYERVGGVVRDAHSKTVVAWLREVGSGNSLSSTLSTVGSVSSLLNLGVSVVGFSLVLQQLGKVQKSLKTMEAAIERLALKEEAQAYATFETAIELAQSALRSSKAKDRQSRADSAIGKFLEAESVFRQFAQIALERRSQVSGNYILILCLAYVSASRCYLELEDMDEALHHLCNGRATVHPLFEEYVNMMLTPSPAEFLHPSLAAEIDLTRLTRVYQWREPEVDENTIFQRLRTAVFAMGVAEEKNRKMRIGPILREAYREAKEKSNSASKGNTLTPAIEEVKPSLPESMDRIEEMIETSRRFDGYIAEVEQLKEDDVQFPEWQRATATISPPDEGYKLVYLIPSFSSEFDHFANEGVESEVVRATIKRRHDTLD